MFYFTQLMPSNMAHRLSLFLFLTLVVGGGLVIGFITAPGEWYAQLVKSEYPNLTQKGICSYFVPCPICPPKKADCRKEKRVRS
jgi:hypothetical protein